jgi:hypothetical protein
MLSAMNASPKVSEIPSANAAAAARILLPTWVVTDCGVVIGSVVMSCWAGTRACRCRCCSSLLMVVNSAVTVCWATAGSVSLATMLMIGLGSDPGWSSSVPVVTSNSAVAPCASSRWMLASLEAAWDRMLASRSSPMLSHGLTRTTCGWPGCWGDSAGSVDGGSNTSVPLAS